MTNDLALYQPAQLSREKVELIKRTIAAGSTDDELALFVEQCNRTGLDPFARQIYSIRRKQWNSTTRQSEERQVIQVSIDGFRLIADRTTKYAGQVGPWWCDKSGEWREVWLEDQPPAAAKVGVLRRDFDQPLYSIALYKSYVQTTSNGDPVSRWKTDPAGMLAKCAEALALRRAFPQELSGLYTTEEMGQASNGQEPPVDVPYTPAPDVIPPADLPVVERPAAKIETPKANGNGKATAKPAAPAEQNTEGEQEQAPATDTDYWNAANPLVAKKIITGQQAYQIAAKNKPNWDAAMNELVNIVEDAGPAA